jgi:hypothetical protein
MEGTTMKTYGKVFIVFTVGSFEVIVVLWHVAPRHWVTAARRFDKPW